MTFGEWLETENLTGNTDVEYLSAWLGWTAGQKAERERYQELIAAAEELVSGFWDNDEMIRQHMRKIEEVLEKVKNDS